MLSILACAIAAFAGAALLATAFAEQVFGVPSSKVRRIGSVVLILAVCAIVALYWSAIGDMLSANARFVQHQDAQLNQFSTPR